MKHTLSVAGAVLFFSVSVCRSALAQPTANRDSASSSGRGRAPTPSGDVTLQGGQGVFVDPGHASGLTFGATGLFRWGPVDAGGTFELGTQFFGYNYSGAAGALGLGLRSSGDLRLDALALAGRHNYQGVGSGLLSDDPGVGGSLPFVGGRVIASYPLFHGPRHLTIGIQGTYESDLDRHNVTSTYQDIGSFGGGLSTQHSVHMLGTSRMGVTVDIGGSFDVR